MNSKKVWSDRGDFFQFFQHLTPDIRDFFSVGVCIISKMNVSNYSGSLLGTATVAIIFGVSWLCKNKLKHSKCRLNSKCLEISSQEDSLRNTIRQELMDELRREGIIPPKQVEGEVPSPV